jgi:hypothetical protein
VLVVLGALLVQFFALGLWQAAADSPTNDEGIWLAGGVTSLTEHELRVSNETGAPLSRALAALPVLLVGPEIPHGESWRAADGTAVTGAIYSNDFLVAQDRAGKLGRVVFASRLVPLLEGALIGLLLFLLGSRLFGRAAGLLAAGLWLTIPYVLGLSHLDGLDIPFTLAVVAACVVLERFIRRPSWQWACAVGVAGGLAMLCRTTGFPLVLVLAVVVGGVLVRREPRRAIGCAALVLVTSWVVVWVVIRVLAPTTVDTPLADNPDRSVLAEIVETVPWPAEYEYAIDSSFERVNEQSASPAFEKLARIETTSYLLGDSWDGARWWYWPGSMLVKLPIAVLLAFVVGMASWWLLTRDQRRRAFAVVGIPAIALALVIGQSPTVGLRYFLPVIALLLVAAGPVVYLAWRAIAGRVVLAIALASQVVFLWASVPHSLAWTAPPFTPGYRSATDSNLDWGQDMYRLEDWLADRSATIDFFGFPGVGRLDDAKLLIDTKPRDVRGWVAVSASLLTSYRRTQYSWLRGYCPVGDIGGTILLYRFDRAPDPRPGPETPAAPCEDAEFSRRVD